MMDPGDHGRGGVLPHYPLDVVLGSPSLKLVVRGRDVEPEELREAARRLEVPGVSVSTSGAPFLEVAAAGVNKASGLEAVCATLGIAPDEVVAFGDSYNDLEMILASKAGFLFRSTDKIKADYPQLPAFETYNELLNGIKAAMA